MILVGQYDSPYTRRVAIAMHLLEVPFERDTRSVFADAEAMRAINPLGRIPALVLDDGAVLIESGAILDYLDERAGAGALLPARGLDRRTALQIVALATGALDKAGAVVYERTLRPPDKQFAGWLERCRTQATSGLAALEAATRDGWYVANRLTIADVTVGCVVDYFQRNELFDPARHPALVAKADACRALDAFRRTEPSTDEIMPAGLPATTPRA